MYRRLSRAEHPNNSSISRWRYQKTSGNTEGAWWRTYNHQRYYLSASNAAIRRTTIIDLNVDLQNLLVGVGALKATDHRVVNSARGDGDESYSGIRTGILNAVTAADDDDD